jgi:hypothetical protein
VPETTAPPTVVRVAVAVLAAEALGLVVAAGVLVVKTVGGHPGNIGRALFAAAMALAGALALAVGARGLWHLRPAARTPMIVLQLLAIPVGYSLSFQAGRVGYGGPILVAAVAVIYLLFTPPAREALER